jgi:shikimate kinase
LVEPTPVLLIGMMGAGKSVVGAMVASRLGCPHLDSDRLVEQRTGTTVARIFEEQGEAAFRAEEAAALAEAVGAIGPVVISVAAGAVLSADNRALLRQAGLVVWLRASIPTLAQRVTGGEHRPLLAGDRLARLTELYAERYSYYGQLADTVIDVDALTPEEVADRVVEAGHAPRAARGAAVGGGGPRA